MFASFAGTLSPAPSRRAAVCFGALGLLAASACASDQAAQQPPPSTAAQSDAAPAPFLPDERAPLMPEAVHAFTPRDMIGMERIGAPELSPDGKTLVFGRRSIVLDDGALGTRGVSTLWSMSTADPTQVKQLTFDPRGAGAAHFSPDGKLLYFVSGRSGSAQLWKLPLEGGTPSQVTDLPLDIVDYRLSPDGTTALVSLDVFLDCDTLQCTADRLKMRADSGETGAVYDRIFVRHWDTWKDGRRGQLFAVPLAGGDPVRVTVGLEADVPPKPWWGAEAFVFTPDGNSVVFVAKDASKELEPVNTNYDLWRAPLDGSAPPERLTDNPAWDDHPVFSPDGKTLAYVAMERPGFESDRMRVMLKEGDAALRVLTGDWDRSVAEMVWTDDSQALIVTTYDVGQRSVFRVDVADGKVTKLLEGGHFTGIVAAGDALYFKKNDLAHPDELYRSTLAGENIEALTHVNDSRVNATFMGDFEQFSFAGAGGDTVYGWIVKPAEFDPSKKYPLAFLIHGGPQGSFSNRFHYRWNPQTYAGAGFVVVTIDFHGSVGYGQDFTDAIRGDWGGKPLEDLQKGLDAVVAEYPFIDADNACALGASYGGYMINWIAGAWPERFKCLVNHDGIFDNRSMYWATEELWFPEWEHGGPYHLAMEGHEKHNPALLLDKWQTPMLVVHGGLDYRVPLEQGLQTFNALQRRGIESKLLYYPDENHWVLKPKNSLQWHRVVTDWLKAHTAQ